MCSIICGEDDGKPQTLRRRIGNMRMVQLRWCTHVADTLSPPSICILCFYGVRVWNVSGRAEHAIFPYYLFYQRRVSIVSKHTLGALFTNKCMAYGCSFVMATLKWLISTSHKVVSFFGIFVRHNMQLNHSTVLHFAMYPSSASLTHSSWLWFSILDLHHILPSPFSVECGIAWAVALFPYARCPLNSGLSGPR